MGVDDEKGKRGDKEQEKEQGGQEERRKERASEKERPAGVLTAGRD